MNLLYSRNVEFKQIFRQSIYSDQMYEFEDSVDSGGHGKLSRRERT